MGVKEQLTENIREFAKEAKIAEGNGSFNSAVTLYFKAIAVASDLFLLEKTGEIPSNHTLRFKILKEQFPEVYKIMDKIFPVYQRSYNLRMDKEYVEEMKNGLKKIVGSTGIKI